MLSLGVRLSPLAVFLALLSCGGEEQAQCLRDSSCEKGFRCAIERAGELGKCVACDGTEVPYDGIDNDCNSRTLDLDLDADGDNAITSAVSPGGDCDDNDPAVNSKIAEVCDDQKDNNCNGVPDEPACRDRLAPSISFVRPQAGDILLGQITVELAASDDVGIRDVELFVNDQSQGRVSSEPFTFNLDSRTFSDGAATLRAVATDVADRVTEATIAIAFDNVSGPTIIPLRPLPGQAYGGFMTIEVDASDASGVASVALAIDGANLGTFTSTPYASRVSTTGLTDGTHSVEVTARDRTGAMSNNRIDFLVDNTGPVVTISPAGSTVMGTISVQVQASDPAGIASISSRSVSNTDATTLDYQVDTLTVPNGPLVITATATDNARVDDTEDGNRGSGSTTLVVANPANSPPAIRITSPLEGDSVYRRTTLSADANAPSGVRLVEFFVDGVSVGSTDSTPFAIPVDFSRRTGRLEIRAVATDGNDGTAEDTVHVDVVRPATFRVPNYVFPGDDAADSRPTVGDVNGDGKLDLVIGGDATSIALGLGDGTFEEPTRVGEVVRQTTATQLADIDGDGQLEIVALRLNKLEVVAIAGNTYQTYSVGNFTFTDLAVGDLDGDNAPDAVVGRSTPGGDMVVALNRSGNFAITTLYGRVGNVSQVELVDIEGDGDLDVLLGHEGAAADYFTIYRNDGLGNFGAGLDTVLPGQAVGVAVGDINRDGVLDVVSAIPSPSTTNIVAIAYGIAGHPGEYGPPLGTIHTLNLGVDPSGATLADVDGDGDLEVLITDHTGHSLSVLTRNTNTDYSVQGYAVAREANHPVAADLDGNGTPEIVVASEANKGVAIVLNRGGVLRAPPLTAVGSAPAALTVADFGGDGLPDVAVAVNPRVIGWYLNQQGRLNFDHQYQIVGQVAFGSIAAGNLDGQGGLDLAVSSLSGSSYLLLENGGITQRPLSGIPRSRDVTIGDVDGDGTVDAAFSFDQNIIPSADGIVVVGGDGVEKHRLISGEGAAGVLLGQLNNDSLVDIAVANSGGDDVALFTVGPGGTSKKVFSGLTSAYGVAKGHLGPAPADAYWDLIVGGGSRVGTMLGHPTLDFLPPSSWDAASASVTQILAGDFNRDGLDDVVVMHSSQDRVVVMMSRPSGGFFAPDPIDTGDNPSDIAVADVDGDGKLDILVSNLKSDSIAVIYNDN